MKTTKKRIIGVLIRWVIMPALIFVGAIFMIRGYTIEALLVYVILGMFMMLYSDAREVAVQIQSPVGARTSGHERYRISAPGQIETRPLLDPERSFTIVVQFSQKQTLPSACKYGSALADRQITGHPRNLKKVQRNAGKISFY